MNIWEISQKPSHFDFALYRVEIGKCGTFQLFARQELKNFHDWGDRKV